MSSIIALITIDRPNTHMLDSIRVTKKITQKMNYSLSMGSNLTHSKSKKCCSIIMKRRNQRAAAMLWQLSVSSLMNR
jgi:hypothetical protein